jgi:hypothetical protein
MPRPAHLPEPPEADLAPMHPRSAATYLGPIRLMLERSEPSGNSNRQKDES